MHATGQCGGWWHRLYTPDQCRLCWLKRNAETWRNDGPPPPLPDNATPAVRGFYKLPGPRRSLPCIHAGAVVERTNAAGSPCHCSGQWLRQCDIHGVCSFVGKRNGVQCCQECDDYEADGESDPVRRHLLYHVLPAAGNGTWQRNADQLKRRLSLFNGEKWVAICTPGPNDPALDPVDKVAAYFGPEFQFLIVQNVPRLREVATWVPLWSQIQRHQGPRDYTFYAHAKGVTRPVNPGVSVHPWADLLYAANLDYWPEVEDLLQRFPIVGAAKKTGFCFRGSKSRWHYSGTFYWVRNADFFAKDWQRIDQVWWGTESFPGVHWQEHEAGCVFLEGTAKTLDLYTLDNVKRHWQEFEQWQLGRRPSLSGTGSSTESVTAS